MARRIGGIGIADAITKRAVWKMPDSRQNSGDEYVSVYLPHPFMHLPSADDILAPAIKRRHPAWIVGKRRTGDLRPFDLGIITDRMPPNIRQRMYRKIIGDVFKKRGIPRPVIKAPPKEKGEGEKKALAFGGVIRGAKAKKSMPAFGSPTRSMTVSALTMHNTITSIAPLAMAISSAAFLMA